jgi:hypothetical protein
MAAWVLGHDLENEAPETVEVLRLDRVAQKLVTRRVFSRVMFRKDYSQIYIGEFTEFTR